MKLNYFLTMICSLALASLLTAQERYLAPLFDDVEVTSNVPYGANFTVLTLPVTGSSTKQPLVMDVYQPVGDTLTNRPLVIYLHTGNFLPIKVNQGLTGSKTDSSTVEICKRLARMGYVVASADYRTGWNPTAASQPERAFGLINAAYRGLQDARTCVRYFKRDFAELGNNYGVDTSKIVMWGQGTGGYIALATATLDAYNEILTTQMPTGKFLTDFNMDGMPDPMIVEAWNGNIDGTSVGISGGIPIPAGDTLSIPNHVGYSSDYQLTVNMGGALGDISWMDENSTPLISYHVPNDQFAPYESAILVVPTTDDPIVEVQGSLTAVTKANTLGLNDVFSSVDDEFTDAAKAASAASGHDYQPGLYPLIRALSPPLNLANGSPWDWWEPSAWDTVINPTLMLSFHQIGLLSNPDMSPEKGRTYIDTIIGYYAPRAYLALGLSPDTSSTAVPLLDKAQVSLRVSPNPSFGLLNIETNPDFEMKSVRILDLAGKMVLNRPSVNTTQLQIEHRTLTPGAYLVEIRFEKGVVTEKVLLN